MKITTLSKLFMSQVMKTSCFFVLALILIAISPGIALSGDVVVDGETMVFGPEDDIDIDNLTVINGGVATLGIGAKVNGNLTVEGEGSYAGSGGCSAPVGVLPYRFRHKRP